MKKFLLIIFLFLSCINVFASERTFVGSEFITGVSYVKDAGSVIQYRNAQVIRDASTGEIAESSATVGSQYQPVYLNSGTITAAYPVQYLSWTFANANDNQVVFSN